MSLRKNRPVLYEVLRKANGAARPRNGTPTIERPTDDEIEIPSGHSTAFSHTMNRWVEAASGRVDFSLGYPVIAAAIVGVIVLAGLAFWTGKRIGERGAGADKSASIVQTEKRQSGVLGLAEEMRNRGGADSAARRKDEPIREKQDPKEPPKTAPPKTPEKQNPPVNTSEVETGTVITPGLGSEPKRNAEAPTAKESSKISEEEEKSQSAKFVLERGKSYIEVQWFRKSEEKDANAAAKYLQSRGVPVTFLRLKDNLVLYAREAFDLKNAADKKAEQQRADDLLQKIKLIGRDFNKDGGRFTFGKASIKEIAP